MDAAEIARLRADYYTDCRRDVEVRAILRALEQAQMERNTFKMQLEEQLSKAAAFKGRSTRAINDRHIAENERDQAQKDAKDARALLGEALPWVRAGTEFESTDAEARELLTRIEAMLEQKP